MTQPKSATPPAVRRTRIILAIPLALLFGCATAPPVEQEPEFHSLAARYVRSALRFPGNPAVRAQAMEAAELLDADARLLVREGLKDEHPGVRFAACMAIARIRDSGVMASVRALASDGDASVRVGAYCALERLGDTSFRRAWAEALSKSPDVAVRRNAVLALGELRDKSVLPLLQLAATSDEDDGVRLQAMEALAIMGNRQAIARFVHDAYGGVGYRQPFALLTLGKVPDDRVLPTLRTRLIGAPYLEAQLAAARALGRLGYADGFDLAVRSLNWDSPQQGLVDDPPANQVMRVRSMAAMALGEMRDPRGLIPLRQRMETPDDPRVQLAAASGILMILERSGTESVPG